MFKDLKVIELAGVLAGPAVGMFFSELGAKVIKVENMKTGGDMTRKWKLPSEDPSSTISAYFSSVNYHKEYISKDLTDLKDRAAVYALIKNADILISNFKKGSAEKLGMDYKTLKSMNKGLIYASIDGFTSNPTKVAFDMVLQAETGFMGMNGHPENSPAKLPVAFIDLFAAHQLKEGILIALLQKSRDGEGQHVSVSLEEAALSSLANQASNFLMENHIPQRLGSLHPNIAPYGEVFTTQEGNQVVLAVGTDHQFKALCDLLSCMNIIEDQRFLSNTLRVSNRKDLAAILAPFIAEFNTNEFLSQCQKRKIPVGEIKDMKQVMENETAKQMVLTERIDGKETKRLKTIAFHLSKD